jgi:hypothetical protein
MKAQLARLATVVAMLATVAACSHATRQMRDDEGGQATTRVHVENQNYLDANVYVIGDGGARQRLGMITGNTNQDFVIPNYIVSPANTVRFMIEPIGSNVAPISESLTIRPGETVTLTIPPNV